MELVDTTWNEMHVSEGISDSKYVSSEEWESFEKSY